MNEIKEIEDKIKKKKEEIIILEHEIQKIRDKEKQPDIIGKCICIVSKNDNLHNTLYIKVKKVTKTELGWIIEGKSIEVYLQLIAISYTLKNRSFYPVNLDDIEIIDDNIFNKVFEEAIKSFNN